MSKVDGNFRIKKSLNNFKFSKIIILFSVALFFLFTLDSKFITNFFADETTKNVPKKIEIQIEPTNNIKILDKNYSPLKKVSIFPWESLRYIAEVDDLYTKNQISSSFTPIDKNGEKIDYLRQNIRPTQVLSSLDTTEGLENSVGYQSYAGGVIMQGDQPVYDTDSIKKYWIYDVNDISTPGVISVYGADTINSEKISIGGDENENIGTARELYVDGLLDLIDPITEESVVDKFFDAGSYLSFKIKLDSTLEDGDIDIKAIPSSWVDSKGKIKEDKIIDYKYTRPLVADEGTYHIQMDKSYIIWINNINLNKYTVYFNAEGVDVYKALKVFASSDDQPQEYSNLNQVEIALGQKLVFGQILTFSVDVNEAYEESIGMKIIPVISSNNTTKASISHISEAPNLWKIEGIDDNITVTFKNIKPRKILVDMQSRPPDTVIGDILGDDFADQSVATVDYNSNLSFTIRPQTGYHWKNKESDFDVYAQHGYTYMFTKRLDGDTWRIDMRGSNGEGLTLPKPNNVIFLEIVAETEEDVGPAVPEIFTTEFGGNKNIEVHKLKYSPNKNVTLEGKEVSEVSVSVNKDSATVSRPQITIPSGAKIKISKSKIVAQSSNPTVVGNLVPSRDRYDTIELITKNDLIAFPILNEDKTKATFEIVPNLLDDFVQTNFEMEFKVEPTEEIKYSDIENQRFNNIPSLISSLKILGNVTFDSNPNSGGISTQKATFDCKAIVNFKDITVSYKTYTFEKRDDTKIGISDISDLTITHGTISNSKSNSLILPAGSQFSGTLKVEDEVAIDENKKSKVRATVADSAKATFETTKNVAIQVSGGNDSKTNENIAFSIDLDSSYLKIKDPGLKVISTIIPGENKKFEMLEHDDESEMQKTFEILSDQISSVTISGTVEKVVTTNNFSTTKTYSLVENSCKASLSFNPLSISVDCFVISGGVSNLSISSQVNLPIYLNASWGNLAFEISSGSAFNLLSTIPIAFYEQDISDPNLKIAAYLTQEASVQIKNNIVFNDISLGNLNFEKTFSKEIDEDEFGRIFGLSNNTEIRFAIEDQSDDIFYSKIANKRFSTDNIKEIRIHGSLKQELANPDDPDSQEYLIKIESCYVDVTFENISLDYSTLTKKEAVNSLAFENKQDQEPIYVLLTPKEGSELSDLNLELLSGDMSVKKQNMESVFDSLPDSSSVFLLSDVRENSKILKTSSSDNYLYFKSSQEEKLEDFLDVKYSNNISDEDYDTWSRYPLGNTEWGINTTGPDVQYQFMVDAKRPYSLESLKTVVTNDGDFELQSDPEYDNSYTQKLYKTSKKNRLTIVDISNIERMAYDIKLPEKEGLLFKNADGNEISGTISARELAYIYLEPGEGYYFPVKYDSGNNVLSEIMSISSPPLQTAGGEVPTAKIQNINMMSNGEIIRYMVNLYDIIDNVELSLNGELAPAKKLLKVYFVSPGEDVTFMGISGYEGAQVDEEGNPVEEKIPLDGQNYVIARFGSELRFSIKNDTEQDLLVKSGKVGTLETISPRENIYSLEVTEDNTIVQVEKLKIKSYLVKFKLENTDINITDAVKIMSDDGADLTQLSIYINQGESLNFEVTPLGKYSMSSVVAKASNKNLSYTITNNGRRFTLPDVRADTTVVISNIEENVYPVSFVSNMADFQNNNTGEAIGSNSDVKVKHGGSFKFKVIADSGYDTDGAEFTISKAGVGDQDIVAKVVVIDKNLGIYEVQNVQQAIIITANLPLKKYNLSFNQDLDENGESKFKIIQVLKENLKDVKLISKSQISIPFENLPEDTSKSEPFSLTIEGDSVSDYFDLTNSPLIETGSGEQASLSINDVLSVNITGAIKRIETAIGNVGESGGESGSGTGNEAGSGNGGETGSENGSENVGETEIQYEISYDVTSCRVSVVFNDKIGENIKIESSSGPISIEIGENFVIDTDDKAVNIGSNTQIPTSLGMYQDITSSGKKLGYGEFFQFIVELSQKYERSDISLSLSNTNGYVNPVSGDKKNKYQVQIFSDNIVTIEGITLNDYGLSLNQPENVLKGITLYDGNKSVLPDVEIDFPVTHGGVFTFALKAQYGYEISSALVYVGPKDANFETERNRFTRITESMDESFYLYTTPKIYEDSKIVINELDKKTYGINFTGQLVTFRQNNDEASIIRGEQKVPHETDYEFRVYPQEGYNLSAATVSSNTGAKVIKKDSNKTYDVYALESVKENMTITVSGLKRNEYPIIFRKGAVTSSGTNIENVSLGSILTIYEESGNVLKLASDSGDIIGTAVHGYDYNFNISLEEEFDKSEPTILTQVLSDSQQEGPSITVVSAYYSDTKGSWVLPGTNITGNQVILTVENIKVNTYKINFSGEGVAFKNGNTTVSTWDKDTGDQKLSDSNSQPTIEHTLKNISNNSSANMYQIEVVAIGEEGYQLDENLTVSSSNGIITRDTSASGRWVYVITNVTSDTTVYVSGIRSKFYLVEFSDKGASTPRFKVYNEANRNITSGIRMEHGENLKFKISLNDAYTNSSINVYYDKNGDGDLSSEELIMIGRDGFYSFENVTKDSRIIVDGIKVNKYEITFDEDPKITFKNAQNSVITSESGITANYGSQYVFKIESNTGYNLSRALVSATNATVTKNDSSSDTVLSITLSNITGNVKVSVGNITLNLYSVTFQNEKNQPVSNAKIYSFPGGKEITSGTQAYFEKELKFKVELDEGYTNSLITVSQVSNKDLSINKTQINKDDDGYYVVKVLDDTLVEIADIKINKYNIVLSAEDELTQKQVKFYKNDGSAILPLLGSDSAPAGATVIENAVEHGSNYSFLAIADSGYTIVDLKASVSGADVEINTSTKNGLSQANINLVGVTKNLGYENPVKISNCKEEKYVVSFSGAEMNSVSILDSDLKDITRSGKEVIYGNDLEIIVNPNVGYEQSLSSLIFSGRDSNGDKVEIEKVKDTNRWIIKNVKGNVSVTLQGLRLNVYDIIFDGPDVDFRDSITNTNFSSPPSVIHGGYFTFRVYAKEGFDLNGATISTTSGNLTEESRSTKEAIYTLTDVDSQPTIEVRVVKSNIDIKLVENEGISYFASLGSSELVGTQARPYGDAFSFIVVPKYGYDFSTLSVKFGDNVLTPTSINEEGQYYMYITPELKEDTSITATINKKKYKVQLPTPDKSDGIKFYENNRQITSDTLIMLEYGNSFQFTVKLDDKHNQSSVTIKANDETIDFIDGSYTISNISSDTSITVEGIEINRYKVNLSESAGARYENVSSEMSGISGVYNIPHGGEISFSVSEKEGYDLSNMVVVCREDNGITTSLEPKDNKYTIKNITSNKTISVQNAQEVKYKISFEPTSGVVYKNDQGLVMTDPVRVSHGNYFEFQVSILDEYDDSVPVVKTTSATAGVQKLSAGKYMISDITEDLTIQVLNVSKNKYTVTLTKITGISYKDGNGKTLDGESQTVEYNDDFRFQVQIQPAYNDSSITVMLGKEEIKQENGAYIIRGIKEDKTVTVTGITENDETVLINTINQLDSKIENSADVNAIIQATKKYNQLPQSKKELISNYDKLQSLQQLTGEYSHKTNDIEVSGVPWNIKLVAVTLSTNTDACSRIYDKLNSEFILSLYDIYLVDMLTGQKYELPEGEKVIITIPTPDLKHFKDPSIVHEISSTGKIEYIIININGDTSSFEMTSFSNAGFIAKKSLGSGSSSLFDDIGDGINSIRGVIANIVNKGGSGKISNMSNESNLGPYGSSGGSGEDIWDDSVQSDDIFGSSSNVTTDGNNKNNSSSSSKNGGNSSGSGGDGIISQFVQDGVGLVQGSAIKLVFILIFIVIIILIIVIIMRKLSHKNKTSEKYPQETKAKPPKKDKK